MHRTKMMKTNPGKRFKTAAKPKTNMKDRLRGLVFTILWYLSIVAGFFLLVCPIIPLVVVSPKKYRKWSDIIFGMWEAFPVAMMEVFLGIRVVLTGDKINPFESSLFIMNHRTRVDWSFLWLGLFHCCQPNAHNMKYVLKAPIMHVPGPGWVMQTCSFIFVQRSWAKDKLLLDKMLDYLNNSDDLYQILLFPEGTDLSDDNVQKSHRYADEHNLERYYQVLHPRTTGFVFLTQKMKAGGQLKAIYDVTVAYPKTMPVTEADLLRGKFPEEVHFHVKRYSSILVPYQEDELKTWLMDVWREKEQRLHRFYFSGRFADWDEHEDAVDEDESPNVSNGSSAYSGTRGRFDVTSSNSSSTSKRSDGTNVVKSEIFSSNHMDSDSLYKSKNYKPSHLLYLVLGFWFFLIVFIVYEIVSSFYMQLWVLTHSVLFLALSFVSNGFHQIAASLYFYRYKRRQSCAAKKTE